MRRDTHNLYLGIFVLTGLALLGGAITVLGARTLWQDEHTLMETYIKESVNGLEVGSPVKFRGIPIGKVERITTVAQEYRTSESYAFILAKIRIEALVISAGEAVDEKVAERVRNGLRVSLAPLGITGGAYLETDYIEDVSKYPELPIDWEPRRIYVPSRPSTLQRITNSLDRLLGGAEGLDIKGTIDAARDTLRQATQSMVDLDLEGLSQKTQTAIESLSDTITSADRNLDRIATETTSTLKELRTGLATTFDTAGGTLGRIDAAIEKAELEKTLETLSRLLAHADEAVEEYRVLARRTDRVVGGLEQVVRGGGREFQVAIGNLREILANLNSLTGTLREYPSLLFVGNSPPELEPTERR